jgi:transposase
MLSVNVEQWGQSIEFLREQALEAVHGRTRERFLALYEICQGKSASQVARKSQRNPQTVMGWVHEYNEKGPEALMFIHTGGHPPL